MHNADMTSVKHGENDPRLMSSSAVLFPLLDTPQKESMNISDSLILYR